MESEPYTLKDLNGELEDGWRIRWEGRTGSEYPPNHRIVELEMDLADEPYTRVRQLILPDEQYAEVEKLREGDDAPGNDDE